MTKYSEAQLQTTPLLKSAYTGAWLKLENTQPSGSFKMRGMTAVVAQAVLENPDASFYCSSGGNAGLAAALAASRFGRPCTVVVPVVTSPRVVARIAVFGGTAVLHGQNWPEADQHMQELMKTDDHAVYLHPFDNKTLWEGHSTMIDEIANQLGRKPSGIVLSVGGGGLYAGVMTGLERHGWLDVPVYAVETENASCFHQTLSAGKPIVTAPPTSIAKSLGSTWIPSQSLKYAQENNTESILVSDADAVAAIPRFVDEHGMVVEPACGAALAALYTNKVPRSEDLVLIVCGGSTWSVADMNEHARAVLA